MVSADRARRERAAELVVGGSFALTLLAGIALLVVYMAGGDAQVEGLLLALALGGVGIGLVLWSHLLMPVPFRTERRHAMRSAQEDRDVVADSLVSEGGVGRRRFLLGTLAAAVGGLVAAFAIPVLSLGPGPGRSLFRTAWRPGLLLVDIDGAPVVAEAMPIGSAITVFPEGHVGAPDAQTMLIRVEEGLLSLTEPEAEWAPSGFVAYSKICTHAGCPVGLYAAREHELVCPCHQSIFNVLEGAVPVYGPAVRPLPQLPIRLQEDGTFVAISDFPSPVGPSFWDMDL